MIFPCCDHFAPALTAHGMLEALDPGLGANVPHQHLTPAASFDKRPPGKIDIEISVPTWIRTHFVQYFCLSLFSLYSLYSLYSLSLSLSFHSFYKLYIYIHIFLCLLKCNITVYTYLYMLWTNKKKSILSSLALPECTPQRIRTPKRSARSKTSFVGGRWLSHPTGAFKHENMINTEIYCNQNTWEFIWGYNRYRLSSLLTWWFCQPSEEYHTWSVGIIIRMGCCWRTWPSWSNDKTGGTCLYQI